MGWLADTGCAEPAAGCGEAPSRPFERRAGIDFELFFTYSLDMYVVAGLDGYFKRANPAFCNLLGYSEDQLLAKPYLDFVHPRDVSKVAETVENLMSGHPAFLVEVRLRRADGSYCALEWTAYPDLEAGLLFAIARDYSLSEFDASQIKLLIDSSPTAVFLVDQAGKISYSNRLAGSIFEYEQSELIGKSIEMLVPDRFRKIHVKHRKGYSADPALRPMGRLHHLLGRRKSGAEFPVDVGLNITHLKQGITVICSVIDVSSKRDLLDSLIHENDKLERANTRLGHLADHDTLTGVCNRRAFERILIENLGKARQAGGTLSIILIDIDRFKQYNDSFGHPAGDEMLKWLAGLMTHNIRKEDTVARVGGEEFVIILPEVEHAQSIQFGERLRKIVENDQHAANRVTISLGAATYSFQSRTISLKRVMQQLVAEADHAMYHSKSSGRNLISHAFDLHDGE